MRRRGAGIVVTATLVALAAGVATRAQDSVADRANKLHFWPQRKFTLPLDAAAVAKVAADKGTPVPAEIQLYSSLAKGPWQAGPKKPLNALDTSEEGRKGITFTAPQDGEYEFSVKYFNPDGSTTPRRDDELAPMLRVAIDTTLPTVEIVASGNGVEWRATDSNLDPAGTRVEGKWRGGQWAPETHRTFQPKDGFAWKIPPGEVLDIRVMARDLAGNENYSEVVRLPRTGGAVNAAFPRPGGDAPAFAGGGGASQARVDYVRNPNFEIDYKIERAGRSGIEAAQLFVQKQRGGWEPAKRFAVDPPAETGQSLKLGYTVTDPATGTAEGTYGFYVAPESGAGKKADPPTPATPAMVYVVYDKTPPFVKITGVQVGTGAKGPRVEFMWDTYDQNLLPDPIDLEYSLTKDAVAWTEIRRRMPPGTERTGADGLKRYAGQYSWDVPDEKLWKFYVRAKCVDRAGNATTDVRPDPVIVDLETPAASITGVRGAGGAPAPGGSPEARPQPAPPAPAATPKSDTPPARPPAAEPPAPATPAAPPVPASPGNGPAVPTLPPLPNGAAEPG